LAERGRIAGIAILDAVENSQRFTNSKTQLVEESANSQMHLAMDAGIPRKRVNQIVIPY
ncbi:unnamed protein product, partial [Didymodactylos carnosus]